MHKGGHSSIFSGLLVVAIVIAAYTMFSVERMQARLKEFEPVSLEEIRQAIKTEVGSMLEAEWVDKNGITRRVRTTKNEDGNESEEAFYKRHNTRVTNQLALYPLPT